MSKIKVENITSPPGNLMMISIFYQIILILVESILLGGFTLIDEVLNVYGVDAKYIEFRSYEDFIVYDRYY